MFRRTICTCASVSAFLISGCGSIDFLFDPANLVRPIDAALNGLESAFDEFAADPFDSKPYPVLLGGNNARVLYGTNLGDIRLNFPGPTGTVIIPGLIGPVNLYAYDIERKRRDLVRPFLTSIGLVALATDGQWIAYLSFDGLGQDPRSQIVVGAFEGIGIDQVLFEESLSDGRAIVPPLVLDDGRVAFVVIDGNTVQHSLRVEELGGNALGVEIIGERFADVRLSGDRLAYVFRDLDGVSQVVLRDLISGESTIIATVDDDFHDSILFLTENLVVWAEPGIDDWRVSAYDIPTGTTFVWADGVSSEPVGASDEFFITQEHQVRLPSEPDRFIIRRYDRAGGVRELARFRDTGLSGQATVLGDRAAWVNPERRVLLAPLAGGDRIRFSPF